MTLKRGMAGLLSILMVLSIAACKKSAKQTDDASSQQVIESSSDMPDGVDSDSSETDSNTSENSQADTPVDNGTSSQQTNTNQVQSASPIDKKMVINEEDNKTYPDFKGATITFVTYTKRPELNGDSQNDARVNAMKWAEKKYNCKIVYKVMDAQKMDEAFTAASLSHTFFADVVTANCIGFVGWCQAGMLIPTDKYFSGRKDLERWNIETGRFQEQHYGVDSFESSIVWPNYMIYNKTLLKNSGLEDPKKLAREGNWDFATFKDYCKKATNKQKNTYGIACFGFQNVFENGSDFEALVLGKKDGKPWYYNGYAYKEDGSYDKALNFFKYMQLMRNVDKSVLGDNTGGLQPVLDAEAAFSKGRVLFLVSDDARALTIRKKNMKDFSVVTMPTPEKGSIPKSSWVDSYTFTAFPTRSDKILKNASSKNISTDDLVAFWMDTSTTWNKARGNAYYEEDFQQAVAEKAAYCLCSRDDAQFLYDMGSNMKYRVTYAASMETGNEVIAGLHMPILLGQKTPAAAIKQTDANIQSYADKSWNKR